MTSALDGGGWSMSRPGRLYPLERHGTDCTGGLVCPRAGMEQEVKRPSLNKLWTSTFQRVCFLSTPTCTLTKSDSTRPLQFFMPVVTTQFILFENRPTYRNTSALCSASQCVFTDFLYTLSLHEVRNVSWSVC